jgi:hypothetical protein
MPILSCRRTRVKRVSTIPMAYPALEIDHSFRRGCI